MTVEQMLADLHEPRHDVIIGEYRIIIYESNLCGHPEGLVAFFRQDVADEPEPTWRFCQRVSVPIGLRFKP